MNYNKNELAKMNVCPEIVDGSSTNASGREK
jgi:hypothetical protein